MILITRPKPEANKLKKKIEDLGHRVHIDSLSKITNLKTQIKINSKNIFLISSKRAAKIFIKNFIRHKSVPLLVVGNSSYQILLSAGFSKILYVAKDSNGILKYIKKELLNLKIKYRDRLIYLTGSVSNKDFIDKLTVCGLSFEKEIIYKTVFKKSLGHATKNLLKKGKISICLLYSQQSARQLCALIEQSLLFKKCENIQFITLSKNITQLMKSNGYMNVRHAKSPSEASLIDLIKKL